MKCLANGLRLNQVRCPHAPLIMHLYLYLSVQTLADLGLFGNRVGDEGARSFANALEINQVGWTFSSNNKSSSTLLCLDAHLPETILQRNK